MTAITDPKTKISFPESITFNDLTLKGTGCATMVALMVYKVFTAALYLQSPWASGKDAVIEQVFKDDQVKELHYVYLMAITNQMYSNGVRTNLKKSLGEEKFKEVSPFLDQFLKFYGDIKPNQKIVQRFSPGGKLEFFKDGNLVGTIESQDLVRAILGGIIGPKSELNKDKDLFSLVQ